MVEGLSPHPVTNCSGIGKLGRVEEAWESQAWLGCVTESGRGVAGGLDIAGNRRRGRTGRDRDVVWRYGNWAEQGTCEKIWKVVDMEGNWVAHLWAEARAMKALKRKTLRMAVNNRL